MKKTLFFIVLMTGLLPLLKAQKTFEVGMSLGATNYLGEIAPRPQYQAFRPAGEIFARYNFSYAISFRANMLLGDIEAKDSYSNDTFQQARNWYFRNKMFEAGGRLEYNFFNFRKKGRFEKWCPLLFAGASVLKSEAYLNGATTAEKEYTFSIPFGAGVKIFLSPFWNLGFEVGARKTFTDRIDRVEFMEVVGASQEQDWYFFTGISLSYVLNKVKCPNHYAPLPR